MPNPITGIACVKDGRKQQFLNLSNAREIPYATFSTMTDAQKAGAIIVPDFPISSGDLIGAGDIAYDNTQSGLSATRVQGAIDEQASDAPRGSVSVTADGVKSMATLLGELNALIDATKLNPRSYLLYGKAVHHAQEADDYREFTNMWLSSTQTKGATFYIVPGLYYESTNGTITNYSAAAPTSGTVLKIVY